ncbi:MAG: 50S ribosomal protein L25/general stress protein Ctc [Rhodospirillales bacterium]|nr:50S ribosomal protein L25/general stress protein Ctc [Rhodospirillales bacterium]
MVQVVQMPAERRERAGKGAARAVRRAGRVPAVVYGDNKPPFNISLDPRDVARELGRPGFRSRVFELKLDGESMRALARDVQVDPVSDRPLHVDFMRFGPNAELRVEVRVEFINEGKSPGLKVGGVLNVVRHDVELVCKADKIPEVLTVDLDGLKIGDSVHISHIKLPEGVRPAIRDRDFTVATIAAPTRYEEEVKPTEAAAVEGAAAVPAEGAAAAPAAGAAAAPAAGAAAAPAAGAAKPEAKGKK